MGFKSKPKEAGDFFVRYPKRLMRSTMLGPAEKQVLLALGEYRSAPRGICPSIPTIARECGLSQSTVQRALQRLKDREWIAIKEQRDEAGDPAPNLYRLLPKAIELLDGGGSDSIPPGVNMEVPSDCDHGGSDLTPPGGSKVLPGGGSKVTYNSDIGDSELEDSERNSDLSPEPSLRSASEKEIPRVGLNGLNGKHSSGISNGSSPPVALAPLSSSNGEDHHGIEQGKLALLRAQEEAKRKADATQAHAKSRKREQAKANLNGDGRPVKLTARKEVDRLVTLWFDLLLKKFPKQPIPRDTRGNATLSPREAANLTKLVERYSGEVVEHALRYLVTTWDAFRDRVLKGKGSIPTISLLYGFESTIIGEATRWAEVSKVHQEWTTWFKDNPDDPYPPPELERRYNAVKEELKSLGLI